MTRDHRGFSLIELLIALTICALVSAGVAAAVAPARAAFERTPAEIDLQQRARTATEAIAQAVRAAGGDAVAADQLGVLGALVPAVIPGESDGLLTRLTVIAPRAGGAQGVLDRDQTLAGGPFAFAPLHCPSAPLACGFVRDMTALITDGTGRFDVLTIASADASANEVLSKEAVAPFYAAGSVMVEADIHTLQLDPQPDGSRTLVRVTAAGAVQPLVDRVLSMWFVPHAADETGALVPMPIETLRDGPWLPGGPGGDYDEDLFRIRRIDAVLTFGAAPPLTAERTFRFAVFLRNAP